MKKFLIVIFLSCISSHASYCYAPSSPPCLQSYYELDNSNFQLCKMNVESYIRQLNEYAECLLADIKEAQNNAIEIFNCKASGKCQ